MINDILLIFHFTFRLIDLITLYFFSSFILIALVKFPCFFVYIIIAFCFILHLIFAKFIYYIHLPSFFKIILVLIIFICINFHNIDTLKDSQPYSLFRAYYKTYYFK